ncbi:MAG TPA: hypothetical protein EYP14_14105 [Planctomycetaceae bacterium]|nr:hypothetical protein [Planctomycetaceae bacterium]
MPRKAGLSALFTKLFGAALIRPDCPRIMVTAMGLAARTRSKEPHRMGNAPCSVLATKEIQSCNGDEQ